MTFLRRHKYILCSLGIYWPVLFVLTHIPVPQIAGQSGMSDKLMHMLAYLVLVFFVWLAISPYEKVRWNRAKVWIVLAIIVWYGATDEWLQSRLGRQMELADFLNDLYGALLGLGILSVLTFWPALLTVSSIFIFAISDRSVLLNLYPQLHLNTAFHLTAYATLTLIWIQHLDRDGRFRKSHPTWPVIALSLPMGLLMTIKLSGYFFYHRSFWWIDIATATFAIAATILISYVIFIITAKKKYENSDAI
jgi:VanZ family protein